MDKMTKNSRKVLVAEDDPSILQIITIALAKEGVEVLPAEDGEVAFQKAVKEKPDVIVLDIGLPKIDGLGVCAKLKATRSTAQIPVGFLTAQLGDGFYRKARDVGGLLYMPKPFNPNKLIRFVQILLSSQRET